MSGLKSRKRGSDTIIKTMVRAAAQELQALLFLCLCVLSVSNWMATFRSYTQCFRLPSIPFLKFENVLYYKRKGPITLSSWLCQKHISNHTAVRRIIF